MDKIELLASAEKALECLLLQLSPHLNTLLCQKYENETKGSK